MNLTVLFLLAAVALFAIAAIVVTFNVSIVISALAWACWGLMTFAAAFLLPHLVAAAPRRQPAAPAQTPPQV